MAAAAGGQRASEVRRPMAVPLVDQQFKIPQNHPSKREGQMGQYSSGRPITPAPTYIGAALQDYILLHKCFDECKVPPNQCPT